MRSKCIKNFLIDRLLKIHRLQEGWQSISGNDNNNQSIGFSTLNKTRRKVSAEWGIHTSSIIFSGDIHAHSPNSAFSVPSPRRLTSSSFPVNLMRNLCFCAIFIMIEVQSGLSWKTRNKAPRKGEGKRKIQGAHALCQQGGCLYIFHFRFHLDGSEHSTSLWIIRTYSPKLEKGSCSIECIFLNWGTP